MIGWKLLPSTAFAARKTAPIDPKWTALFRMTVYSAFFGTTALVLHYTGYQCFPAFFILWVFPLVYVFPYLMLVREIFQHGQRRHRRAGQFPHHERFPPDPVGRPRYGNDYHLVHHLYPNIPCYRLAEVHEHLASEVPRYRREVTETKGLRSRRRQPESPSLLDCLAEPKDSLMPGSAG